MAQGLLSLYKCLYAHFGPQRWWPARTPFEVIVGAILTQNTSWGNVEKAIVNLRAHRALTPCGLNRLGESRLASLIRSAGYYNVKARRLKAFMDFLSASYAGDIRRMSVQDSRSLRKALLGVKGIGPETADSILLYAFNKPVFVIDAYTRRILGRHGLAAKNASYEELQSFFMRGLPRNARLFNEFHALLVRLAKEYCLKNNPRCKACPLKAGIRRRRYA